MNRLRLCLLLLPFVPVCAAAQETAAAAMTADEIVAMVHFSRALGRDDSKPMIFPGELQRGGKSVPFRIELRADLIRFSFDNPKQVINLDINDKGYRLKEVTAGSNREVPAAMYGSPVRGTDLTYDDLSFRYLYWPKRVKIGEESIKTRKCYVVDLYNPQRTGGYYLVRIFVDRESGGLMRMQAYDWNGKRIKTCTVSSGMKVNGATMLKTMEVVTYNPDTQKATGETTFELSKPVSP
jgi:hypothetical protein